MTAPLEQTRFCPRRAVVSACVHVVTLLSCAFLKPLLPFCRSISNSITTSLAPTVFFPLSLAPSLSRFSKRLKTIFCKPGKKIVNFCCTLTGKKKKVFCMIVQPSFTWPETKLTELCGNFILKDSSSVGNCELHKCS